jgi:regulator of nucleoside diphosphate kinase
MLIDIRHLDHPVSDALNRFTERRVARALRPFQEAVAHVDVRTKDVNGPRGGIDIECSVKIDLAPVGQPVIVSGKGADPYVAVMRATARLHEAVSRALGRQRRTARPRASVSGAPLQPTSAEPKPDKATPDVGTYGSRGDIVITVADQERLRKLIEISQDTRDRDAAEALADELDRADVVPAERIAGNVVTMNSRVVFEDEGTRERREISLVYPEESDPEQGRISILAAVGTALLGLSVGQTIDWPLPQGRLKRYRVVEVVYQPEAAGHLHL